MIKVLKHGTVYAPEKLGQRDVLIAGEKILRIAEHIDEYDNLTEVEVIDMSGKTIVPGYIDLHEHITGGGGEQGPGSRCPEMKLSELVQSGVTTVLGRLGTDGVTRSVENLLAKCKSLNEEGITAYMLTGAYGYPSNTLLGSVERDVMLIAECVGVKVAVSDHRSSNPDAKELANLATDARRGGLLGGRAGITVMHMGGGKAAMDPILQMLDESDVPAKNLLPTHMGRTEKLLEQGREFIKRGGTIDITAGDTPEKTPKTAAKIAKLYREGVDFSKITSSSDGCGSMPRFDAAGNCIGLTYASPLSLHRQIVALVKNEGMPLEDALRIMTVNPAAVLCKTGTKGCIAAGADADILALDADMTICDVFARGKSAMRNGTVLLKGKFED